MPLNRATREWVDIDALADSAFSNYVATEVMVEQIQDLNGNQRHVIWQISSVAIDPDAVSTYDQAPTGSVFIDNVGVHYRKAAATTWTAF